MLKEDFPIQEDGVISEKLKQYFLAGLRSSVSKELVEYMEEHLKNQLKSCEASVAYWSKVDHEHAEWQELYKKYERFLNELLNLSKIK